MSSSILPSLASLLDSALGKREALIEALQGEGTDAYRLFHGVSEGMPGLTIDRYGPLLFAHSFREALSPEEVSRLEDLLRTRAVRAGTKEDFGFVYNHRGKKARETFDQWHQPSRAALQETECREMGVRYRIRARHAGIDPWLFLDLRSGRRRLRAEAQGKSVLNLFAYTCSAGVTALAAGAREAWNIDFSEANLAVGQINAELNGLGGEAFRTIQEDCLPILRQLAGLPVGGRFGKTPKYTRIAQREFDWVFLDPPTWAKGSFGAVDIAQDYASLFKPAVLIARPNGGRVLATNHLPSVSLEDWKDSLTRCAAKAGRPLKSLEILAPEADFPSFDGAHPLKIAVCEV